MLKQGIMLVSVFILSAGMAFATSNTTIVIESEIEARTVITGTVTDATSETPIQNAVITLDGTDTSTTTDEAGMFTFSDLESGTHTVNIRAEGYEDSESRVEVTEEGANVQIALTPRQ